CQRSPARDLGRVRDRPVRLPVPRARERPLVRDGAVLRAREPNLIAYMRRVRDRAVRPVSLPGIGALVNEPAYAELVREHGRPRVVEAVRAQIAHERKNGGDESSRREAIEARLRADVAPRLRRALHPSGLILHTNLRRAPLSKAPVHALALAAGYSHLDPARAARN